MMGPILRIGINKSIIQSAINHDKERHSCESRNPEKTLDSGSSPE